MKKLRRYILIAVLMLAAPCVFPASSEADDTLLDGMSTAKHYLVQLSGTVMNETFSGAQALLTLMPPPPAESVMPPMAGSGNPYQIIIQGFPKKNSRNSLFWNSTYSEMTVIANEITCDIKRTFVKTVPMHFIWMSPELLRHTGSLANLAGDEGKRYAEKTALPTLVNARAGKLKLSIHANSVSGTVWMKGYDPVENAFVLYSAHIYGQRSYKLQPKQELKK
ncbi:MAG: hypothetical protein C0394_00580 [Syntrophus sp. (in: bacteria)]|nr:hypothetical protein [Syntrophus sp. (in: bacteria)]